MFAFLLLSLSQPAHAQDRGARADDVAYPEEDPEAYVPPPKDRLWYSNATYVRVNPLGLVDIYRLGWRHRLSKKDGVLLQDTYTFIGPAATVTPAWTRVGAYGEVQPLAVLRLFTEVVGVGYFGTFDQVLPFEPDARFSDQSIEANGDRSSPTTGWVFTAGATVRAKVGPIAARSTFQALRFDLGGHADGTWFYEQLSDRLAPDEGWILLNDADLIYLNGPMRLGMRHSWSETATAGAGPDADMAYHRAGPLFAWQFSDKAPGARFNQPSLFVMAQWWLQHPYRTGAEQPQALPLMAAGFAFNGDLATSGRTPAR